MTIGWAKEGSKYVWDTWIGDAQVRYVVKPDYLRWEIFRKVMGAADRDMQYLGTSWNPEDAKKFAENDQSKGL